MRRRAKPFPTVNPHFEATQPARLFLEAHPGLEFVDGEFREFGRALSRRAVCAQIEAQHRMATDFAQLVLAEVEARLTARAAKRSTRRVRHEP